MPSSDVTGKIFSLDLQDSRMKPVELRMPRNFDLESFNPHGISVYTDPSGKNTHNLYVVAHVMHKSHLRGKYSSIVFFSISHFFSIIVQNVHTVMDVSL